MNNIERFKQLEKQITWVEENSKGEYKTAGLGVDISVGKMEVYVYVFWNLLRHRTRTT